MVFFVAVRSFPVIITPTTVSIQDNMPRSDASDRSLELRTAALVLWSLAATATALRIYVRVKIMKAFTIDDWFMMLAMVSCDKQALRAYLGLADQYRLRTLPTP